MPGVFSDSAGKRAVRELWNTPLLRHLNETYGIRYRYLGLPGVQLLDVQLWKDMIDEVVAFEVRARPNRKDPQGRRLLTELRRNLRVLGIPGRAYFGPMEEIVILRQDYDGVEYRQDKLVTIYNLDFCDEIGSKIDTRQKGKKVWRFQAIRQMLADQYQAFQETGEDSLFIMLLTIRNQIGARKLREFLDNDPHHDTQAFVDVCESTNPLPSDGYVLGTHTWGLKAFLHDSLRKYCTNPHISALFFPIVKYEGTPTREIRSPMFHLMVLCRFDDPQKTVPLFVPHQYLTSVASVRANGSGFLSWDPEPGEPNNADNPPSPVTYLENYGKYFLKGMKKLR